MSDQEVISQLSEHLKNGDDWEKMEITSTPGLFVVKVPKTKKRPPILQAEINPMNGDGKTIKKKGLFIANKELLEKFNILMNGEKLLELLKKIKSVNPDISNGNKKLKF